MGSDSQLAIPSVEPVAVDSTSAVSSITTSAAYRSRAVATAASALMALSAADMFSPTSL